MAAAVVLYRSTIGKKVVMAVSGLILVGFVIIHMIGNLKIFQGPDHINTYGAFLREVGYPIFGHEQVLWIARVVLLVAVILHMLMAWQLVQRNYASRPVGYKNRNSVQATYASLTMRWGGLIILFFVIFHLLDLTVGAVNPAFVHGDVYHNMVASFSVWYVALFYILANIALGMHLYHGIWSMFQTLGLNNRNYTRLLRGISVAVALIVALGNISIPLAVLTGIVS